MDIHSFLLNLHNIQEAWIKQCLSVLIQSGLEPSGNRDYEFKILTKKLWSKLLLNFNLKPISKKAAVDGILFRVKGCAPLGLAQSVDWTFSGS